MSETNSDFWGFTQVELVGHVKSAPFLKRYPGNPVLSAKDIPYKTGLVFNCSVIKENGQYIMVFRNDYFYGEPQEAHPDDTNFGIAYSDDGINWLVKDQPIFEYKNETTDRVYDPRISVLEGR